MSRTGSVTSGDSRGRLYDEADDRDAQAAASTYAHRGPARDVHHGPMGDGHVARAGEDHSIHQGPRENVDDRCDGDGHDAGADGTASAPEQGAREHAHCASAADPTPANLEQDPLDGTHAAHDGAEHEGGDHDAHHDEGDTHEARDDEGEHRGPDGTGDACEEHPGGDHEEPDHDDDAHRGGRQDGPAGMEHAYDEGEHGGEHAGEHGPDEAHEQADCSSVIAGEDMLLFEDRSEWGDDEDHHALTAHEEEAHEIGAPCQPAATDDGPSEHGMQAHDHGQGPGHEMVCPPAGDGLLML